MDLQRNNATSTDSTQKMGRKVWQQPLSQPHPLMLPLVKRLQVSRHLDHLTKQQHTCSFPPAALLSMGTHIAQGTVLRICQAHAVDTNLWELSHDAVTEPPRSSVRHRDRQLRVDFDVHVHDRVMTELSGTDVVDAKYVLLCRRLRLFGSIVKVMTKPYKHSKTVQ